jgi:pimeloyl-ACP methyl ester carboxylesterase
VKLLARILGGLLCLAALLAVGLLVASWAPDRPVSELTARWAPPPSQFMTVAGQQVHVRDEGAHNDATPIVLLHGTSDSLHTWDGWVAAIGHDRRVVRVDLPGFGLTGPAPDGDYRIERYVEFVTALLDALGIEQCVLAGNSLGGWIAWESALALPGRVRALVLVDSAGYPLESQSVPIGFRIAKIPVLNQLLLVILPRSLVESSLRNTYGDPSRVTPALVDRYYELTLREGNRAAVAQRFADGRHALDTGRIRALRVPTLILWGGRDRLIPPQYAERFHRDISGSRVVMFPRLGHVPQQEDPATTAAAMRDFLAEVAPAAVAPAAQP